MKLNTKTLGLALAAALAICAVAAPAAQATEAHLKADSDTENAIVKVEQDPTEPHQKLALDSSTFDCDMLAAEGTAPKTTDEVTLESVEYYGRTSNTTGLCSFIGLSATLNFNGCQYTLHAGETTAEGTSEGTLDLICPEGQEVEYSVFGCTVSVPEQASIAGIGYHEVETGGNREITVEINAANITYEEEGFFCSNPGEATNNGEYEGRAVAKAFEDITGEQVDVTLVDTEE